MGAAAYKRGSRSITRGILRDYGMYREPTEPTPRPTAWGEKAHARAYDRAVSILKSNRKLGRNIDVETLAGCVIDREHVGKDTAQTAAEKAFNDLAVPEGQN